MTAFLFLTSALLLSASVSSSNGEIIDLSYDFDNDTLYWFARDFFNLTEVFNGKTDKDIWYKLNRFSAAEHGGTHMDAPNHFNMDGWGIDEIPTDWMMANAAVVDITERAAENPDSGMTAEDLENWKNKHGDFQYPTVILVYTGFHAFWPDRNKYFGITPEQSAPGGDSWTSPVHQERHFPGITKGAAEVLAKDKAVVGVGIDTASIDIAIDSTFPAHVILAKENIYNLENLGDMSCLPASGARIYAFPMKIKGGSGAPCRVLVEFPKFSKRCNNN